MRSRHPSAPKAARNKASQSTKLYGKQLCGRSRITNVLDKRIRGVVTGMRELLAAEASGKILERNPHCWVYVVPDGEHLTKIGHALDVDRRFAR